MWAAWQRQTPFADFSTGSSTTARRRPARVLAWMLGFHLVVWTLVPALMSANLQLDLVEGLALGKEWQLGYWKHPPLPWWVTDLAYRLTGRSMRSISSARWRP